MSHCYGIVSTTLRQVTHNVPNYTYLLCNVNPACPINTAFGHTYLPYLHSVKIKVQPPWPSTQLQLSLEHPRAMFPRQLKANGRQWSHPGEDTRTQSPTTSVSQVYLNNQPMSLGSTYSSNVTIISTASPTTTSLYTILLQQLSHLYNLYCYSKYYIFMTHIVTAPTTSLCAIL
jgi:hypothetical protein